MELHDLLARGLCIEPFGHGADLCPNGSIYPIHMLRDQLHAQMALYTTSTRAKRSAPCPNGSIAIYLVHMLRDQLHAQMAQFSYNNYYT